MKVLILFSGQFPGSSAGAKRIDYYKKGLTAAGMPTDILPIGNITTGRINHYSRLFFQPFKAAISLYKSRKIYGTVLLYGFDWISLWFIALSARICGIKLYLEVNEKPGTVYGSRVTELGLIKLVSTKMTEHSFRFFDGLIVISSALEHYLKQHIKNNTSLIIVPIISDIERQGIGTVAPVTHPFLLHAGALSDRKDGIGEVMEAFAIATKKTIEPLHIYFTSKVAPKDLWQKIQQVIIDNDLQDRVHFLGEIAESDLLAYQKFCSMVIINKHINEQNLHNFPTKLGEYLVLQIPVITTGVGEMGKYLKHKENALIVPVNDVAALADAILYLLQHPEESRRIAANGRKLAETEFHYYKHGKRLKDFFISAEFN